MGNVFYYTKENFFNTANSSASNHLKMFRNVQEIKFPFKFCKQYSHDQLTERPLHFLHFVSIVSNFSEYPSQVFMQKLKMHI